MATIGSVDLEEVIDLENTVHCLPGPLAGTEAGQGLYLLAKKKKKTLGNIVAELLCFL